MFFVCEHHEENYFALLSKFPVSAFDRQYQVGCYITALPEIYSKIKGNQGDTPFTWYELSLAEKGRRIDLSSGFNQIVRAGYNLFNGYCGYYNGEEFIHDQFNLFDGINNWGDELFNVFLQSLRIASGLPSNNGQGNKI